MEPFKTRTLLDHSKFWCLCPDCQIHHWSRITYREGSNIKAWVCSAMTGSVQRKMAKWLHRISAPFRNGSYYGTHITDALLLALTTKTRILDSRQLSMYIVILEKDWSWIFFSLHKFVQFSQSSSSTSQLCELRTWNLGQIFQVVI